MDLYFLIVLFVSLPSILLYFVLRYFERFRRVSWVGWFFVYLVGSALDYYSTYRFVSIYGSGAEGNPLVRRLLEEFGFMPTLIIHGGGTTLLLFLVAYILSRDRGNEIPCFLLFVAAMVRFIAFINNTMFYYRGYSIFEFLLR